jgi:hypothetical protein
VARWKRKQALVAWSADWYWRIGPWQNAIDMSSADTNLMCYRNAPIRVSLIIETWGLF